MRFIDGITTSLFFIAMIVFVISTVFLIVFSNKNKHYEKTTTASFSSFIIAVFCIFSRTHLLRATLLCLLTLTAAWAFRKILNRKQPAVSWKLSRYFMILGALLLSFNMAEIFYVHSYQNEAPLAKLNKNKHKTHLEYLRTDHKRKLLFEGPYKHAHPASIIHNE